MIIKDIIERKKYYIVVENIQYIELTIACCILHFANGDTIKVNDDTYKQIIKKLEEK